MTLPVPGGILAQLAPTAGMGDPATLAAMMAAAKQAGQPPAPGAAIAPPTVASNAQAPAPVSISPDPAPALPGPDIRDVAASLPQPDVPQRHGILGAIGDKLHDPEFRAEALRFAMGAMSPGGGGGMGGLSRGILAATQFADQRKADAEKAREFDTETGLKNRGLDLQGTEINNNYNLGHEGHVVQTYGIDRNAATEERGQDVQERGNIRSNATARANNITDNTTSRGNAQLAATTSVTNNNNDNTTARAVAAGRNATDLGVAEITSGTKHMLDPKDAMHGLGMVLPGLLGTQDAAGVAKALEGSPDLQAQLVDAYTKGYGNGGDGAIERATNAVKDVLGQGASYTDDNSWLPFHGQPEITLGQHGQQDTGNSEVRYDANGLAYTKGPNGTAVRAPKFDKK